MIKVLTVLGTRPEAIKMAPVIKELENRKGRINAKVCVTAQHREMLDQILELFQITPDYDLNLMRPNQNLAELTAWVLNDVSTVIQEEQPDWLLVQGDTTTVMAASLAAFYLGVKVGHVEAGLRTGDNRQPFPEEINRRIASVIADYHFAPTDWARSNLISENIPSEKIRKTGNTVIDALHIVNNMDYNITGTFMEKIPWHKKIILITAHRRENFGQPIIDICCSLKEIAIRYENYVHIVYPVHLNPNIQKPVYKILSEIPNISLLPPIDYLPLVYLMNRAYLVITDSGGIQEEAPGFGKPVLVLRSKTERPEGIEAGVVKLVGTDQSTIVNNAVLLLDDLEEYERMAKSINPYGDGKASKRIVDTICATNKQEAIT